METRKFATGSIIQMRDHEKGGKTEKRTYHNYLVLGKSESAHMGMYQCMCITSMEHATVNFELPLVFDGYVSYIEVDNIHSFNESQLVEGIQKDPLVSNRFMNVDQFVMLCMDLHMIRTLSFLSGELYESIVRRFDEYCRYFERHHSNVREYRFCKTGKYSMTADLFYKYKPIQEVTDIVNKKLVVTHPVVDSRVIPVKEETVTEMVPCEFPFENELMPVENEAEKTSEVNVTKRKGKTPVSRIMDADDLVILQCLERDADKRLSKWNDTCIRRAATLLDTYKSCVLAENSKRWPRSSAWTGIKKRVNEYEAQNVNSSSDELSSAVEIPVTKSTMEMKDLIKLSDCMDQEVGDFPTWSTEHLRDFKEITDKYSAKVISENNLLFNSVSAVNKARDRVKNLLKVRQVQDTKVDTNWHVPVVQWSDDKISLFLRETETLTGKKKLEKFTGMNFGDARKLVSDARSEFGSRAH